MLLIYYFHSIVSTEGDDGRTDGYMPPLYLLTRRERFRFSI